MQVIQTDSPKIGVKDLAKRILSVLNNGKPVFWLVCGGSNIGMAVETMRLVKSSTGDASLLTVGLTDERFGPVGHKDSNWKQLEDAGFDFRGVRTLPVLEGKGLEETVDSYSMRFDACAKETKSAAGFVVALFGIGSDGHIAGILPNSSAVKSEALVSGYEAGAFTRVTLTFNGLRMIDDAYAFVFGSPTKNEAINKLINKSVPLEEEPCQILKEIGDSYLYTDISES